MWCSACAHSLKKKKVSTDCEKILHNTENTTLLYYRRGRWGLLLWAIQCQKMMWLRTERSNRFSTVQYGSDVLSYPFGKLLHQVMHLWSSKCCRVWASWNGFQFFHMLCRQLMTTMSSNRVRVGTVDWWLFTPSFARAGEKTGYCASSCSSTTYKLASGNYWLLTWF